MSNTENTLTSAVIWLETQGYPKGTVNTLGSYKTVRCSKDSSPLDVEIQMVGTLVRAVVVAKYKKISITSAYFPIGNQAMLQRNIKQVSQVLAELQKSSAVKSRKLNKTKF